MQETQVQSLDQQNLEKGMPTHSSILAWRNPLDREAWRAIVRGVSESWTWLSNYHFSFFSMEGLRSGELQSVQSLSRVRHFVTSWIAACQAFLSITNSWSLPKLMSIESVMLSSHLILCRPLSSCPQSLPASGFFSNESTLHMRWPKYWSFSFSVRPSNEPPGLISFRMDWLDLLEVQGTLKSLLQKKTLLESSPKASILQHSVFFIV